MELSWKKLLSSETLKERTTAYGQNARDEYDGRTPFDSDYDRIIFSYPFRRLQDKAQLFPLESNDFVRTRLTHSLEVAALAKSIGISIAKKLNNDGDLKNRYDWIDDCPPKNRDEKHHSEDLPKILECAGLVHDLGNPPFGHFGEETIANCLSNIYKNLKSSAKQEFSCINLSEQQEKDIEKFEGNSQSFRILTHLQCIKDSDGYHCTSALLSTIMKYPVPSDKGNSKKSDDIRFHKFGYFYSENGEAKKVFENTGLIDNNNFIRHPLTFLLEAADDMAYCAGDIEDGFKKHIFTIDALYNFMEEFNKKQEDAKIKELLKDIKDISKNNEYYSEEKKIQDIRIKIQQILFHSIIETFFEKYNNIMNGNYNRELIKDSAASKLRECLKEVTRHFLFKHNEVIEKELMAKNIISFLVKLYADGLFETYSNNGNNAIKFNRRIKELISLDYLEVFKRTTKCDKDFENIEINNDNVYYILLLVADQISGMTDNYCLSLYRKLHAC